jgi:hypothetical protein
LRKGKGIEQAEDKMEKMQGRGLGVIRVESRVSRRKGIKQAKGKRGLGQGATRIELGTVTTAKPEPPSMNTL